MDSTGQLAFTPNSSWIYCLPHTSSLMLDAFCRVLCCTLRLVLIFLFWCSWPTTDMLLYVALWRTTLMTKQRMCVFVFFAWLIPFFLILMGTVTTATTRLCGSHIPKIFCVNRLISRMACSASVAAIVIPAFNYTFYFAHCGFVCWSYIYI